MFQKGEYTIFNIIQLAEFVFKLGELQFFIWQHCQKAIQQAELPSS